MRLPSLREELGADFCIVNGENAAAGRGITAKLADKLLASGADVVTLGNWTWGQQDFAPYLAGTDRVLRPANMSPRTPGRGPRGARRRRGDQPARDFRARSVREPVPRGRSPRRGGAAHDACRDRRLPRRGDEREGRARPLPRRPRDRGARNAHARADVRCARACRRHRGDHRRRHDRPARLRDRERRAQRDQALHHRDAVAARARDRRRADRGRARRMRRRRPRYVVRRLCACPSRRDEHGEDRDEHEVTERARPTRGGSRPRTRSSAAGTTPA